MYDKGNIPLRTTHDSRWRKKKQTNKWSDKVVLISWWHKIYAVLGSIPVSLPGDWGSIPRRGASVHFQLNFQGFAVEFNCLIVNNSYLLSTGPVEIFENTTEPSTEDRQETTTTEHPTQMDMIHFLIGASAGGGFVLIVILIVSILCCCAKRQKTRNLIDRLEDNKPKCAVTDANTLVSLNNETTQPLCENDSNADSNDSTSNDVVVEVEDNTEESDYLTPVDSQTEIKIVFKHENDAKQKRNEAAIYARPLSKNSRLLPPLLTPPPANVGEKNGENGAEEQATVPSTESEKSTFQTRNSGKNRYQDLKYPTYENWAHNKGTYMSLLKENDQNDNQSRTRVPSEVAYVNLPKKSSPLLT